MPGLDSAITDATDKLGPDGKPLPVDTKVDDKKVGDKKDDKIPTDDDGLTEAEIKSARAFYRGLKDPDKAPGLIDYIAKQAGYSKIETPQDVKDAKKDIKSSLLEALGPEYEAFVEKLGPALDKILKEKLDENTKDIRTELENEKNQKLQNESLGILKDIAKDQYGDGKDIPDEVYNEMKSVMEDFNPGPNMSLEKYLKQVHTLAVGNLGLATGKNNTRVEKNRNDAASRLASERGAASGEGTAVSKKMSLDESVKAAMAALEENKN